MGFWDKFVEKRDITTTTTTDSSGQTLESFLFSEGDITEDNAMNIPAVNASVELISSTIAQLPFKLYKENGDGSAEEIIDDKRLRLLNDEANDFLNAYNLKKEMVKDISLHGASYVTKIQAGNTVLELHPIPANSITIQKKVQNGYRTVGAEILVSAAETGAINQHNQNPVKFKHYDLIIATKNSKDGLSGKGVLKDGKKVLNLALNEMLANANYYERGTMPLGLIEVDESVTPTQFEKLKTSWQNLYAGIKNSAKTLILPRGVKYNALTSPTLDGTMSQRYNDDIYKLFGIQSGVISTNEGNQYQSLVQNKQAFLENTLMPYIATLEAAVNRSLLLESEKDNGYYFRLDTSELMRGTEKERLEAAILARQAGFSINEVRNKFDLPDIANDFISFPSGEQFYNVKTNQFSLNGSTPQQQTKKAS